jgi:uncharacterized protein (DUF1501 family)
MGMALPHFLWASQPTDKRLFVLILRGAMDGLAAVPPIGDPQFVSARGDLAQAGEGAYKLDSHFALNKNLPNLAGFYKQGQAIVCHATALPYRSRSHFDAQNILESGMADTGFYNSGWLNRTIEQVYGQSPQAEGLALASTVQLILRGKAETTSWLPNSLRSPDEDFIKRISLMYQGDPLLESAIKSATDMHSGSEAAAAGKGKGGNQGPAIAAAATKFLLQENGPRIAVMDIGGFDSHAGQIVANGRLNRALQELDNTIKAIADGCAPVWNDTSILVATEFGRTVAMNGTAGSDHGTGTAAFLVGGKVRGGQVVADWPGLAKNQLYEGRDLMPTMDMRSLFKGVLAGFYGVGETQLVGSVFPGSNNVRALTNLYKT